MSHSSTQTPQLSVIVPAYNEADRLPAYLHRIVTYLDARRLRYEMFVVDDGSRDRMAQLVEQLAQERPHIRLIRLAVNMGKGAAVRRGMQAARGTYQLFTDADGATPIEELAGLEAALAAGADVAIGSRALGSRHPDYRVEARPWRSRLGASFNALVQRMGIRGIADTQCGFKLFRRAAAHDLFTAGCVNGYAFDLELLYLAQRRGYRIAEVPINWTDQPGSKVRPWRDGLRMLRELLAIRRRDAQGCYAPHIHTPDTQPPLLSSEPSHS